MKRIITHWTGGSYTPSSLDKEHYHFLIDGDGVVHEGVYPVEANRSTSDADGYAAHTRFMNTGSIGVALCAMAGATPTDIGSFPIKDQQWESLFALLSKLCDQYDLPITPLTVLSHAEVEPTLGVKQRGKWDISVFPFTNVVGDPVEVGDTIREWVLYKNRQDTNIPENPPKEKGHRLSCTECGKLMLDVSRSSALAYSSIVKEKIDLCQTALLKIFSVYFEDEKLLDEVREHVIEGLIMVYQGDTQLTVDGIVGPKTWNALESTVRLYQIDDVFSTH